MLEMNIDTFLSEGVNHFLRNVYGQKLAFPQPPKTSGKANTCFVNENAKSYCKKKSVIKVAEKNNFGPEHCLIECKALYRKVSNIFFCNFFVF